MKSRRHFPLRRRLVGRDQLAFGERTAFISFIGKQSVIERANEVSHDKAGADIGQTLRTRTNADATEKESDGGRKRGRRLRRQIEYDRRAAR